MSTAAQVDFGFRTPPRKRRPRRGRPPKRDAGVRHAPRQVNARCPQHVTLKLRSHVWNLRARRCYGVLERAFYKGCDRFGGRVCHFSVQHNHVHLVVEAADAKALARALQGLCIRMAKGLNRVMGKKGAVFADRYHARLLRTPTEVRRVLVYVLANTRRVSGPLRKHLPRVGHRLSSGWMDPYTSAAFFDGWNGSPGVLLLPGPVAPAKTWLLSVGYQRAGGPLRADEMPRADT